MPVKIGLAPAEARVYGWDASHYDGPITAARAREAKASGIVFATHKLGEGGNYRDPLAFDNLAALKAGGIEVLGGYYVVRTPGISLAGQVAHCIAAADALAPWWRTWPDWFFQVDLELWPNDRVSAANGVAFAKLLQTAAECPVVLYASHGMYGDQLTGWDGMLWNANYGANLDGPFRDVYPGDASAGWAEYSGQVPAILQYGSRTRIAGLTTCDANAFRGSLAELKESIKRGSPMALTTEDRASIVHDVWYSKNIPSANPTETPATAVLGAQNNSAAALVRLDALAASQAGQDKALAALAVAVSTLAGGGGPGGSVDLAPVLAAVADVKAVESAAMAAALAETRQARADLAALRKAIATGDTAAAAALAG